MPEISRRDFLKIGSLLPGALAVSRFAPAFRGTDPGQADKRPNILIFVFDAMSAANLSVYGYGRKTTPNLERFAERATVFNQHYSAGNFTTPGTASLLTGLYPWTHRAINSAAPIARKIEDHNIFRTLGNSYYRLAFSQNVWPYYFFGQFQQDIEKIPSPASFSLLDEIIGHRFGADLAASHRAFDDFLFQDGPASLVFGVAENIALYEAVARNTPSKDYPDGFPHTENYPIFFKLDDVFAGLKAMVEDLPKPSLAYLHLWSPHAPYRATEHYYRLFHDGRDPQPKPAHPLAGSNPRPPGYLIRQREKYDEYIANLDAEIGSLLDFLEGKGILDESYVILTSDHGELTERGVEGHFTPLLYDPVVRVPLLISSPGQKSRRDVNLPTDSVDLLPTLVHLAGGEVPDWCEGQILPGLGGAEDAERSVFSVDAKEIRAFEPLTKGSFAMRKGSYKLIYYMGFAEYGEQDKFELYDMDNDSEELNDLFSESSSVAETLKEELITKVRSVAAKPGS